MSSNKSIRKLQNFHKRKAIRRDRQQLIFSRSISVNSKYLSIGSTVQHANSITKPLNNSYKKARILFFHLMTLYSKKTWRLFTIRYLHLLTSQLNFRILSFCYLLKIDLNLMIIYSQNRQNKFCPETLWFPNTKWLIYQCSPKWIKIFYSLCFISIKVRPSNIWQQNSWWRGHGDFTKSSMCGFVETRTQHSKDQIMRQVST